jgi:hypothetical protein
MDAREVKLRNALARIFEPYNPQTWEHCDIPGRDRIDEAIREIDRERELERGQVRELHALLAEALTYEREAWETDDEVGGADLVAWFGDWRARADAALTSLQVYGPEDEQTVVVRIFQGLIDDVSANVPGLRVIIQEQDKDLDEDEPKVVEGKDGSRYWMQDWRPEAGEPDRAAVEVAVELAEEMARRVEAADAAEKAKIEANARSENDTDEEKYIVTLTVRIAVDVVEGASEEDVLDNAEYAIRSCGLMAFVEGKDVRRIEP